MPSTIKISTITQEIDNMKEKPYQCVKCDTVFPPKALILHYFKTLIGNTTYQSSMFDNALQQISRFVTHLITHKGEKSNQSDTPESDNSDSDNSVNTSNNKGLKTENNKCNECGEVFPNIKMYYKHLKTHPGILLHLSYNLACFNGIGTRIPGLDQIMDTPYRCNMCDTLFPSKVLLIHYFKTLIGEHPYQINKYQSSLEKVSNFVNHLIAHRVEENESYQGDLCEQDLADESELGPHQSDLSDHILSDESEAEPNISDFCEQTSSDKIDAIDTIDNTKDNALQSVSTYVTHLITHPVGKSIQSNLRETNERMLAPESDNSEYIVNPSNSKVPETEENMCSECGEVFRNRNIFYKHLKAHPGIQPFKCSICNKAYAHKTDLTKHRKKSHIGESNLKCNLCDREFWDEDHLKLHVNTHIGKNLRTYQCDVCNKTFKSANSLSKHNKRHTGYKPYLCTYCGKSVVTKSELNQHLRKHTGEKPFICHICSLCCSTNQDLSRHLDIHSADRKKTYQCDLCSKTFYAKHSLTNHKKLHTGEKPYKCEHCDMSFAKNSNCVRHARTHTDEKPYKCSQCNKNFQRQTKCCQGLPTIREKGVTVSYSIRQF